MGDSYTRQALSGLAVEEHSFDLDELPDLGPGGPPCRFERCLDHTLEWIKAQLGAPLNARSGMAPGRSAGHQPGRDRDAADRTAMMFVTGIPHGAAWHHSDQAYVRSTERLIGLRPWAGASLTTIRSSLPEHGCDLAATLEQAAGDLPQNSAVMVRLRVGARRHAVAMHKDRFGAVRFFDANLGIFRLDETGVDWLDTWLCWYASAGSADMQPAETFGDRSGWYSFYRGAVPACVRATAVARIPDAGPARRVRLRYARSETGQSRHRPVVRFEDNGAWQRPNGRATRQTQPCAHLCSLRLRQPASPAAPPTRTRVQDR